MKFTVALKRSLIALAVVALVWLAIVVNSLTYPAVFLHYSATASAPVAYIFNEDHDIHRDMIRPGETIEFRSRKDPAADYFISISLPMASRDEVRITPPFSRVDVYVDANAKIERTVEKNEYWARFSFR